MAQGKQELTFKRNPDTWFRNNCNMGDGRTMNKFLFLGADS